MITKAIWEQWSCKKQPPQTRWSQCAQERSNLRQSKWRRARPRSTSDARLVLLPERHHSLDWTPLDLLKISPDLSPPHTDWLQRHHSSPSPNKAVWNSGYDIDLLALNKPIMRLLSGFSHFFFYFPPPHPQVAVIAHLAEPILLLPNFCLSRVAAGGEGLVWGFSF